MGFLSREYFFASFSRGLISLVHAFLKLRLDHIDDAFEPFAEKDCVLATTGFPKVGLVETHARRFFF